MPAAGTVGEATDVPVRAHGVQLLGEVPGSGYRRPPALARRADGQVVQLSPLLYLVLAAIDGNRDAAAIAAVVSTRYGRRLTAGQVRSLTDRLRPLGLLRCDDGAEPVTRPANPLLGLRFKVVVSSPDVTRRITRPFAWLFHPAVLWPVLAVFAAVSWWVLFHEGLASATRSAFDDPGLLLLVVAITACSAGFHEFGHAAACRYGGATPGAMGAGLYLVWPAFYTEVNDSYRLGRAGRLRVDLGGLYFNAVFAVAVAACYALTGWKALLLAIAAQVVQMIRQLVPLVRFDGYHVLADLVGVPDLYAHIKPTLRGLLPWRRRDLAGSALKPWARAVVSGWVLLVVPLLVTVLLATVLTLPRVVGTALDSLARQWGELTATAAAGDPVSAGAALLGILATALALFGVVYVVGRTVRRGLTRSWRWTAGRPRWRRMYLVGLAAGLAILTALWWPQPERYRPLERNSRGAVLDLLPMNSHTLNRPEAVPSRRALPAPVQRAQRSVWAAPGVARPTRERPQLALVLTPRPGSGAPTWVFPFNRPEAPGAGDNQALAVNTGDGSTVYDVSFALVWAGEDEVLNTNEAYALASCRGCRTVAIAYQVVLVVGQADVVVPQNISAAVNYNCTRCLTLAIARQLVLTLPRALSPEGAARVEKLWQRIAAFAETLEGLPADRIGPGLEAFERELVTIIREDLGIRPSPSGSVSSGPGATPSAGSSPLPPSGTPSVTPSPSANSGTPSPSPSPDGSPAPSGSASGVGSPSAVASGEPAPQPSAGQN